ncbi:DUF5683 domain-containing protein [Pseudobacter ginsenosidimutans]|uniref:DUF5683 domain-containing protein n=1 Tax=Pseudobacter ginsenosidimutans TaxID=661488 RepID=A0A4Q7MBE3_9BACT|nr:DUF5683 domain-containing protein [Pseudobacter ginsenosidimutans]QEC42761.1 hypothetical protein FSB84_14080 [Pseudobacter ginsenosidimutans]RZS65081.1 hypothetical protein EV199_5835 [Pseudobacter ginsenosidimutans]
MIRFLPAILLILMSPAFAQAKAVNPVLPPTTNETVYPLQWRLHDEVELAIIYYCDTVPVAREIKVDSGRVKADSIVPVKSDTAVKKKHSPRKAAIRSAIIPGWGQIYNKKYWKVPIVWAAVGIPAGLFVYNKNWYDRIRYALAVVENHSQNNPDSMNKVHEQLRPLVQRGQSTSLLNYRSEYRRNMDYSILFGLLLWGLNIVDATVDAHLRDFDVSDNISMRVSPAVLPGNVPGVSFVFTLGANNRTKTLPSLR